MTKNHLALEVCMRRFIWLVTASAFLIITCSEDKPTQPPAEETGTGTLLLSRLSVSVVPGGSETITVCATDPEGSTDNCTITCTSPAVATATITDSTLSITGKAYGTANVIVTSGCGMTRTIPVQVYNQHILDAGELLVTFVDSFTHLTGDTGDHIQWYHPIVPEGFHALGSFVKIGAAPNGKNAMMVVKAEDGSDALASPTGYELLVNHETYLGPADLTHGIWDIIAVFRPIPPDGYVALGCVATGFRDTVSIFNPVPDYREPSLDDVVCVREDLTANAEVGDTIWSGDGYSYWFIDQPNTGPHEFCYLVAGTIFGWNYETPPGQNEVFHVLDCELPMLSEAPYQSIVPRLTGYDTPQSETAPMMSKAMLVPCTIINDPAYEGDIGWQVANSPLYRLERQVYYKLQYHNHNQTETQQTNSVMFRSGTTTTETETFSSETSIAISAELGISIEGIGGKISGTFTRKFGYETQTSVAELQERWVTTSINTPPFKAAACWQRFNRYVLYRHDGTDLKPVTSWEFGIDSYVTDQYPK